MAGTIIDQLYKCQVKIEQIKQNIMIANSLIAKIQPRVDLPGSLDEFIGSFGNT